MAVTAPKAPKKAKATEQALSSTSVPQGEDPEATLLQQVKDDYNAYFIYIHNYRVRWENYWRLWNNIRIKRQYKGDNDSFEPMTFQMVETIVDNVYGSRPKFTFLPTSQDQEMDTKALNALLDASWDQARLDALLPVLGREKTITGNIVIWPCLEDGLMNVRHFPIADCIFDVRNGWKNKRFAGYRRLDMLDNLKSAKWFDSTAGDKDPETGEPQGAWVPRYHNLDTIPGTPTGGDLTDTQLKEQIYAGSTLTGAAMKHQVEVIYMHYMDKVVEVANRSVIIYEGKNYYQKDAYDIQTQARGVTGELQYDETQVPEQAPYMSEEELAQSVPPANTVVHVEAIEPFIPAIFDREFVDPGLLLGKGTVEPFADTQEELNDILNAKRDNVYYNVQNVGVIDELAKDAIEDFAQAGPGSIIPIPGLAQGGENTFRWLQKPDMGAAADLEINRAKESLRETARISQMAQGIIPPGVRTAMEIQSLMAQVSAGFNTRVKALEVGLYQELGEMFVKMVQIFLTEEQVLRVIGQEGVEFQSFDPNRFWGVYDVKVELEQTAKAEQAAEAQKWNEAMQLLSNDPSFNQTELKKLYLQKALGLDPDEIDRLASPQQPGAAATDQNGNPVARAPGQPGEPAPGQPPYSGAPPAQPQPPQPAPQPLPAAYTRKPRIQAPPPKVLTRG